MQRPDPTTGATVLDSAEYAIATRCRGCGRVQDEWFKLLVMDPMPLAGRFCDTVHQARTSPRFPLTWVQCAWCELVQVLEDVPDSVLFRQYQYGSSTVPGLVRHFEEYARFLVGRFGDGPLRVLEVGANDGVLLKLLPETWRRVGVDPSDVARRHAAGEYELLNVPFTRALAQDHPERGMFDVVTSSNAMAHFTDLHGAFEAAHVLLRSGGELILEVHDLSATLEGGQWDTIYHEHKVEWSDRSLRACLQEVGFAPTFTERLPLHGGLLRCGFKKVEVPTRIRAPQSLKRTPFEPLVAAYTRRRESPVYAALAGAQGAKRRLVAYGASGRANVWLNQMPELSFEYVVDDSPLRYGRWLPSIAVPIHPSAALDSDSPDICLITAWNYSRDIQAKHPDFRGTWLRTFDDAPAAFVS